MEEYIDSELLTNYKRSLMQKYNAVCLDIDGTITSPDSKKIDERAIDSIARLLIKNVPVVFITGRGETGLEDLLNDIKPVLFEKYGLSASDLRKMYVLVNDGARLFYTGEEDSELLCRSQYLVPDSYFAELNKFNDKIVSFIEATTLKYYCKVTYSYDSKTGRILNIRLNCRTKSEGVIDAIYDMVLKYIADNSDLFTIARGIYKGNSVIQIGVTKKDFAIANAEKKIGIPENSMLRIGDCGDELGSDYEMLDCPQGFSVKEMSSKMDVCFPVINEDGEMLEGLEATLYLLDVAKILPTICLEKIDKDTYKKEYALVERQINIGSNKQINAYNAIFNIVFSVNNGINDIFDPFSGSVIIPMYEWELIPDDNPLKQFFEQKNDSNNYINLLRDNKNILLRGSGSYYYLLANRKSIFDYDTQTSKDNTSLDDVLGFLDGYITYFREAAEACSCIGDFSDLMNKRMLLGILDNVRNALLVLINECLVKSYDSNKCVIINLETLNDKDLMKKLYVLLVSVHKIMISLCTIDEYSISPDEIVNVLLNAQMLLEFDKYSYLYAEEKDYSKVFRAYREIDNFAENFLTVSLVDSKNQNSNTGMCGLSYGGIELPIIYRAINDDVKDTVLFKFSKSISNYRNSHSVEIRNFGLGQRDVIINDGFHTDVNYILADDNLLTAKTMQLAINAFYDLGASVQRALIVRYPSINRFGQMIMENHGAVDYKQFFNFIQGLLFPSPYTFRDEHNGNKYLDSLGVFDVNRQKILECIYKNHDFAEDTEVSILRKHK